MRHANFGSRLRRGGVAAAMAVCAVAVAAPAADAKGLRFGVHSANNLSAGEVQRMGAGDTGALRVIFRWSTVEPEASGPRHWELYDSLMARAGKEKIDVIPILVGTPEWVPHQGEGWSKDPQYLARFQQFVGGVVERYGRNGEFWRLHPETRYTPIKDFQIWNEPNRPVFSPNGDVDPRGYGELLKLADAAIRHFDPKANTVIAGMPERTTTSRPVDVFVRRMYKVPGVEKAFDVMTLHPYAEDQRGVQGAIERMRRLLKKLHDRKRELWLTEIGWGSGGDPGPFSKSPKEQASLLRKTFKLLRKNRKKYRLGTVIWFSWRDRENPGAGGPWQDHTGLFKRDGGKKPAWDEFTSFTGGEAGKGPLPGTIGFPLSTGGDEPAEQEGPLPDLPLPLPASPAG